MGRLYTKIFKENMFAQMFSLCIFYSNVTCTMFMTAF